MAQRPPHGPLRISLLDALAPASGGQGSGGNLKRLKESVRGDLQDLLNARRRCLSWSDELEELERSVLDYGVPDLTGANLSSQERRARFLREIESVIRRHDPRFLTVKVESTDNSDPFDRTLRFRIQGTLKVESGPEQATFDFRLEPITRHFE